MARTRPVDVASVKLWGSNVGAVAWNEQTGFGTFEYEPSFVRKGLEIAPLAMPLRDGTFSFPNLNRETFYGLPGLLSDSLPDRYGNRLIDLWLARQGRSKEDFSPVERLCYMATRGMGALEFSPALGPRDRKSVSLEVNELARLAADILKERSDLTVNVSKDKNEAINTIIRIGTSAGGARAKAVIAWNPETREIRSGQVTPPPGFQPWILKFDGVDDASLGDPQGFGRVEFAYHKMAVKAGIEMYECRLLEEKERAHFMTRRFDRDAKGGKIHMQSLCAMGHYDYNSRGGFGYEQALATIQQLNLGHETIRQMYRRMIFNIIARNQDDHTRNIAFLMDLDGKWSLSPAFDVIWSYNSSGQWTNRHHMSLNGKTDDFNKADLGAVASAYSIKKPTDIIKEITDIVSEWPTYAKDANVDPDLAKQISKSHRLKLAE